MDLLTTKEVCERLYVDSSYIRKITKKAANNCVDFITCRGERFKFTLTSTLKTRGKAYLYTPIAAPRRKISLCAVCRLLWRLILRTYLR